MYDEHDDALRGQVQHEGRVPGMAWIRHLGLPCSSIALEAGVLGFVRILNTVYQRI